MNPMPSLEPMLKQLRLSGILDSLEARNRQAIESKLAYTEFLALLIQDEVARRDQRQFDQRLRRAQVRSDKTLERFDFSAQPHAQPRLDRRPGHLPLRHRARPGTDRRPERHGQEPLGAGARSLRAAPGLRVLFTTHAKLLGQLHAARATNAYERKLQQLAKIALIVIDDFGLRPMRSPQDEDLPRPDRRALRAREHVVTSNLDFDEWGAAFPNKLLGAATLDRLRDGAYRVVLDGETRRKPRPHPQGLGPHACTAWQNEQDDQRAGCRMSNRPDEIRLAQHTGLGPSPTLAPIPRATP